MFHINGEIADELDTVLLGQGGNHEGVKLLNKRVRQGKVEHLVRLKFCPSTEDPGEMGSRIGHRRVREFKARKGIWTGMDLRD